MFLGIGQAAQPGMWSTSWGYGKGKDELQREGPGKLLPHWSGCSLGSEPCADLLCQGWDLQGCYSGLGGVPLLTYVLQKQSTDCLACISSFYRHTVLFFPREWKCTSTAQENHFPPSSPHEMKAVTGRILLFVDLGTRWNDSHRSEVNMFLRLLLFISLGFMGFPVHGRGNSSFTCVCAEEL